MSSVSTPQSFADEQQQRIADIVWSEKVAESGRLGQPMPQRDVPPAAPATPLEMPREPIFVPPPASPPPSPAEAEAQARQALIAAVATLDDRVDDALRYEKHVSDQRKRIDNLQSALAPYADLDERMISAQLDKVKAGNASDSLPADLEAQRSERGRLIDRSDLAAKTLDRLLLEQQLATTHLKSATSIANAAATRVIIASLMSRIAQIKELEAEAAEYRSELQSLAETWLPGADGSPRPPQLPVAMVTLLREPPQNTRALANAAQRQAFVELHQRLLNDPQTEFPPP